MIVQDFVLYGGEWYDGKQDKMRVFGNVFRYQAEKGSWTLVTIPNRYAKLSV